MRGNLYVTDVVTPTLNTWNGPSSELEWIMLSGRGTDDGVLNITIAELGSTVGAKGQFGYVSIPQTMWNGLTNTWALKPWFDESQINPPRFANQADRELFNTKLTQQTFASSTAQQMFSVFNKDNMFK